MKKLHTRLFMALLVWISFMPNSFSQNCFYATADSKNASNGSQTCVDISVHGFEDISSFQFSLFFNKDVLTYSHAENVNLPIPLAAQFGTPLIDFGILTFFWLDTTEGHELPDRTVAFSTCFDVIGAPGDTSVIQFTSDATDIEVYDSDLNLLPFHGIPGMVVVDGPSVELIALDVCEENDNCSTVVDLVVEGGVDPLTYSWVGPNGFTSSDKDLIGVLSGGYDLTVSDMNGLSATASYTFGDLVPEIVDTVITNVDCSGFNNGAVNLTIQGGTAPVEFIWSNGSTFEDISGVMPGDYTITVTDAGGCEIIQTFTILGNDPIELVSVSVSCETDAGNDGFITLEVMGGSGNYSFDWSFGGSTSTGVFGNLPAGDYEVSVTDEFNCPYIIVPFGISAGISSAADVSVCVGESVSLNVNAPKGETFSWSPATFLSCTDCPNPTATPDSDIEYYISVVDSSGCMDFDTMMVTVADGCMWPGDTDLSKEVSHYDLLNIGLGAGEMGPARMGASIAWNPQLAMDWTNATPISMVNFKYVDSNGDGTIDLTDTIAIADNWGEMHNFTDDNPDKKFEDEEESIAAFGGGLAFTINAPDSIPQNTSVSWPIELGTDSNPAEDVYGLAFSIYYDPTIVVIGSAEVELKDSWLGTLGADLVMMQRTDITAGRIDVAITGMDGMNRSGFGQIALLNLEVQGVSVSAVLNLRIDDEKVITNVEQEVIVGASSTMVTVVDLTASVYSLELNAPFDVFPNPAKDVVYIDPGEANIESVELFDITGRQRNLLKVSVDQKTLFVPEGMSGSFILRVRTDRGLFVRRLVLID